MPRIGGKRRKSRTQKPLAEGEAPAETGPCCLVIKHGEVGPQVGDLVRDIRQMFAPNTFMNLRESKRNRVRDFVAAAGNLGATHMVQLSRTDLATYMRMCRLPQGPTVTFKVDAFSLGRDVRTSTRKPRGLSDKDYMTSPVLVMNGFTGSKTSSIDSLIETQIRGMFPAIDVPSVNIKMLRRVVLANWDSETQRISMRHYAVSLRNSSVSRTVRKILQKKKVPSLGHVDEVAALVTEGIGYNSESELDEFDEIGIVPGAHPKNTPTSSSLAVRLVELGPRLDLQLVKIEAGISSGEILFHKYLNKTAEEEDRLMREATQKKALQDRLIRQADLKRAKKEDLKQQMKNRKIKKYNKLDQNDDNSDSGEDVKVPKTAGTVEFEEKDSTKQWKKDGKKDDRKNDKRNQSKKTVLNKFHKIQKK